jgi:molybdopterin-guanine dinucleotide biosynthesis protein A
VDTPALTALVLAGGEARRLGGAKRHLQVGGRSLLARSLDAAGEVAEEVLLLPGARPLPLPQTARCIPDRPGAPGPLGALAAGLDAARHDWCLLLPCDMPFIDPAVVRRLLAIAARGDADAVVVCSEHGREPFHALYHRGALPTVLCRLDDGERSLKGLLDELTVHEVTRDAFVANDPGARFLCNVNTPEDLARARGLAEPVIEPATEEVPA